MISSDLSMFGNHLWQSTLCVGVVWLLTLALRKNRAAVRYWLWLAASVKFLIPFSLIVSAGSQLGWRTAPAMGTTGVASVIERIGLPFAAPTPTHQSVAALPASTFLSILLLGAWACGFIVSLFLWFRYWRQMQTARRLATPLNFDLPIPVMSSPAAVEPGVFGIREPVLLLPQGIADRLTPAQLEAVLAHEVCHVRRRDNLTAAIHMLVESVFWFHPLVWWIRTRLVQEREGACDEAVLSVAVDPQTYAEGILSVCKFYLEAPPCVAGVAGADLRKRLERILARQLVHKLSLAKRLLLASAGFIAIVGPLAIGLVNAPAIRAQSTKPAGGEQPAFEVASIKPARDDADGRSVTHSPGARLTTSNATLKQLIYLAYQVMPFQVSGGPNWVNSDGFDIEAKAANSKATQEQFRRMIQTLLADRFQLKFHFATKELPVYALVVAKNGPKLVEVKDDNPEVAMRNGRGEMTGVKATMPMFAVALSRPLQRKVVDETGLKGAYAFKLQFVPDENPAHPGDDGAVQVHDGPSLFTALGEQLGLNLKPSKGPVEVFVIDHAEKPTPN
jgi:bla regulator protein BlaR1